MRQLLAGLTIGSVLGAVSATLIAQRAADSYPDAVTADRSTERCASTR